MRKISTTAFLACAIIMASGCSGTAQQTTSQITEAPTTTAGETAASTAGTAPSASGRIDLNLTEEEFRELDHKVFLANKQETMFERHSSQSIVYINSFPSSENSAYAYYITPDSVYQEFTNFILYDKDGFEYQVFGIDDPSTAEKWCILDFREDWKSSLWRYVQDDEKLWMDYDHDHFVSAFTEEGKLHFLTRFDEELSRDYCENTIGAQYEGEIYTSETMYDENNYDLLAVVIRKELNGITEVVNTILFEYDAEESSSKLLFRMMFEHFDEDPVTVTITIDPDTEHEASKTVKLPPHVGAAYFCDDIETVEAFDDRECTIPRNTLWDRVSDLTMYLKHTSTGSAAE